MSRWPALMVAAIFASAAGAPVLAAHQPPSPSPSPSPSASPSESPSETPSPEASDTPLPVPSATHSLPIDGAYSLMGGIWSCETLANSRAISVYTLTGRTLLEKTTLHLPGRAPVELDTTFTYHPARRRWSLNMQRGAYVASAKPWTSDTWTFIGIESDAAPRKKVRLVYTSLGPDAYRSDFQVKDATGTWHSYSGATCKRSVP